MGCRFRWRSRVEGSVLEALMAAPKRGSRIGIRGRSIHRCAIGPHGPHVLVDQYTSSCSGHRARWHRIVFSRSVLASAIFCYGCTTHSRISLRSYDLSRSGSETSVILHRLLTRYDAGAWSRAVSGRFERLAYQRRRNLHQLVRIPRPSIRSWRFQRIASSSMSAGRRSLRV